MLRAETVNTADAIRKEAAILSESREIFMKLEIKDKICILMEDSTKTEPRTFPNKKNESETCFVLAKEFNLEERVEEKGGVKVGQTVENSA